MKTITRKRRVFTKAGAFIRKDRRELIAGCFNQLMDERINGRTRNKRLALLAVSMIEDGQYAKPLNYSEKNEGSWKNIRFAIVRHLWREWMRRNQGDDLKYNSPFGWWSFVNVFEFSTDGAWFKEKPLTQKNGQ